jgi:hypothetical protein
MSVRLGNETSPENLNYGLRVADCGSQKQVQFPELTQDAKSKLKDNSPQGTKSTQGFTG